MDKNKFKFKFHRNKNDNNKDKLSSLLNKFSLKLARESNRNTCSGGGLRQSIENNSELIINLNNTTKQTRINNELKSYNSIAVSNSNSKSKELLTLLFNTKNINNNQSKTVNELIKFYFVMQTCCTFPPILEADEYLSTRKITPNYLISAILSCSCSNSPNPELKYKNLLYSEYFYRLSLSQLSECLQEPSVFMIQTLLILGAVDDIFSRALEYNQRITSAIKLSQTLGFNDLMENYSESNDKLKYFKLSSLKKIWFFLKTKDATISNMFCQPTMLPGGGEEYEFIPTRKSADSKLINILEDTQLSTISSDPLSTGLRDEDKASSVAVRESLNEHVFSKIWLRIPRDYLDLFKVCSQFADLIVKENRVLDVEFKQASAKIKFKKTLEYITNVNEFESRIPLNLKHSLTCLNPEEIAKNPILRIRTYFYQKILNVKIQLIEYIIELEYMEWSLISELCSCFLNLARDINGILEDYLISIGRSNNGNSNSNSNLINNFKFLNFSNLIKLGQIFITLVKVLKTNKFVEFSIVEVNSVELVFSLLYSNFYNFIKNLKNFNIYWKLSDIVLNQILKFYHLNLSYLFKLECLEELEI